MKKDLGGFPDSGGEWGGYGYGYWNSLRIAYDVTIKNVKTDIEINDEWVRTSNTKTGVYLNRGVENLQVYNAYTEYQGGARENPPAINGWKDIPDGGTWLDAPSFAGYSPQRRNNAVIEHNADPQLLIRGDVKNGYGSVTYLDDSRTATHGGDPFVVENSSHASAAGHGFYGAFPLFAVGYDEADNSGTRFNLYGGLPIYV